MGLLLKKGVWFVGDGCIVVGSQDGQIRLYNGKQFTRANTAVPGLGAPITSVDVTYDGKWILATTKSYLMVVKTIYKVCCCLCALHILRNEHLTSMHGRYLCWPATLITSLRVTL